MIVETQDYSRLTKLSKNRNAVRTESMLGFARLPQIGERLVIVGRGLEHSKGVRVIVTSLVKKIVKSGPGDFIILTENSTYRLERLGPGDDANEFRAFLEHMLTLASKAGGAIQRPHPRPRKMAPTSNECEVAVDV
ncbi:MAG: hypothetical protein RIR26_2730 [Pseudomonadota bacterium]